MNGHLIIQGILQIDPDKELIIAFQINNEYEDEGSSVFEKNQLTTNISDGFSNEKTFQIDYVHPFGEKKKHKKNNSEFEMTFV